MTSDCLSPDQVVLAATRISAKPYDHQRLARKLSADTDADLAKWLDCWSRIELMDMHLWPTWDKEVHDILQPLFKELQLIFLAYTRSISEDSAEDAMEMSMDEFHDFVVDVGLETKKYKFEVMQNQFVKANATNVAQVRQQRIESRRDAQAKGFDREVKSLESTAYNTGRVGKVKQGTDGQEVRELTAANDQQPRRSSGTGMLTAQPRGTSDPATAPASWRTLNLPPPTTP